MVIEYSDAYMKLGQGVVTLVFVKRNGEFRTMLATRNTSIASLKHGYLGGLLDSHDRRHNIENNNIAVIDLVIGDVRAFKVSRAVYMKYHGYVSTEKELDDIYEEYEKFKKEYEESIPERIMEIL